MSAGAHPSKAPAARHRKPRPIVSTDALGAVARSAPAPIPHTARRLLLVLACFLIVVVIPHVREDFAYGDLLAINARPALAAVGLLLAAALHASGLVGTLRRIPQGALLLAASGALWSLGVIVFHGHDLLFAGSHYRSGLVSRVWEVAIIAIGAGLAVTGWRTWVAVRGSTSAPS